MLENVLVHIDWSGPFTLNSRNDPENRKKWNGHGVYQVYGKHPVYGQNSLLYIGKAFGQSFYDRAKQHYNRGDDETCFFSELDDPSYYLGTIKMESFVGDASKLFNDIEALLIYSCKPAGNANFIKNLICLNYAITILNWNNYANLPPELSYSRWSFDYWNKWNKLIEL